MTVVLPGAGAASVAAAADELIAPLAGAVEPRPLPWRGDAGFGTDEPAHQPLVLVRLLRDLGQEAIGVEAIVGAVPQPPIVFDEWSERGTQLVAFAPATGPDGLASAFDGTLGAARIVGGAAVPLSPEELRATVSVELVQGMLGRLVTVMLSEKARLRRQARELRAMRRLRFARDDALDRMGTDVAVPRLADRISWDAAARQVAAVPLAGHREPDADYRPRLRPWRGFRLPSPAWIDDAVNGPGDPGDAGGGWMSELGFPGRVGVDETSNPLLLAFRLVAPGLPGARASLLDAIRRTHLVWAEGDAAGDAVHSARMLPAAAVARVGRGRSALAALSAPAGQPVAPALAAALERLEALQARLGVRAFPALLTGQRDDGGSRYELGLGAQLAPVAPADLVAAVQAAQNLGDPSIVPVDPAADPEGAWILRACGLRTAQRLDDGTVYASPLSVGGLVVDVATSPDDPAPLTLSARIETGDGSTVDAPLAGVVAALAADGLAAVDAAPIVAGAKLTTAVAGLSAALARLDLPRVDRAPLRADIQQRFVSVSPRDVVAVDLGPVRTAEVLADPAKLADIVAVAAHGGASSVLPLVTAAGALALVFGIVDLPLAGNNLAAQHTVAFRWQSRSLRGAAATLSARRGPVVRVARSGTGVGVVACLAYVRTGANDPYQWRPVLPQGVLLDLRQYEHLMNIVELVTPAGVRANTWDIRRRHVDVDGSGAPTPLSPSAARTYHRYRTR